ncbi:MAG: tetratricopeptide repeat protein [Bryobacteraceae bacterium]
MKLSLWISLFLAGPSLSAQTAWDRHMALGNSLVERQAYTEAEQQYRLAASAASQLPDPQRALGVTEGALGNLRLALGLLSGAESHYRQSLKILRQYDPAHPKLAALQNNLGEVLWLQGRTGEALQNTERALAILERNPVKDPAMHRMILRNLATLHLTQGNRKPATAYLRQCAAALDSSPIQPAEKAEYLNALAVLYLQTGATARAAPVLIQALSLQTGPALRSTLLNNFAVVQARARDLNKAAQTLAQSETLALEAFGGSHASLVPILANRAAIQRKLRQHRDAAHLLERAIAMQETATGPQSNTLIPLLRQYAATLGALGLRLEARQAASRAQDIPRSSPQGQGISLRQLMIEN